MFASVAPRARIALVLSAVVGVVIAVFLTAQLVGWDEERVTTWVPESSIAAAVIVIALLVCDTVLPIPSTILMLGTGALLGPIAGWAVNGVGLLLAALAGHWLGRMVPAFRDVESKPLRPLLIAATRGLPVLSESVSIGAGVVDMPRRRFTQPAAVGSIAVGGLYAVAGWLATNHWSLVFVAIGLASVSYLLATRVLAGPSEIAAI